jgi:hypothetical protein
MPPLPAGCEKPARGLAERFTENALASLDREPRFLDIESVHLVATLGEQ